MNQNFSQLISEAIQLERNVGKLYLLFKNFLPDDSAFWWELAIEEENHAALLKTAERMDASHLEIPSGIMPAGESHYNNFMANAPGSRITEILRKLNRDDLDHARRIREYMAAHHIT